MAKQTSTDRFLARKTPSGNSQACLDFRRKRHRGNLGIRSPSTNAPGWM